MRYKHFSTPEEDPVVQNYFLDLCHEYNIVGNSRNSTGGKLWFDVEEGNDNYAPWLTPSLSHQYIPMDSSEFLSIVEDLCNEGKTISTETLVFRNQITFTDNPKEALPNWQKFLWLNSPIADLDGTYEDYLESLTAKRRYKLKQAYNQYSFNSSYTIKPVTKAQDEFVKENLHLRFKDDNDEYEYALRQWLWFTACSEYGYGIIQEVTEGSILKALTFHIVKRHIIRCAYFQGIIKDEEADLHNIGAFCLAHLMKHLPTEDIRVFDPTCKTSVSESTVDTYKRLVVNTNCVKPVLYASLSPSDSVAPPLYNGKWECPEEPEIIFEGV